MTTTLDIAWLAGILEGEGAFMLIKSKAGRSKRPIITLNMTDKDIVQRVANMFKTTVQNGFRKEAHYKPIYKCEVSGSRAVQWMFTIFTFMGERRRTKIKELIKIWQESELYIHAPKGSWLPAICHPDKKQTGKGLCNTCYMRQYRKYGSSRNNANWKSAYEL